MNGVTEVTEYKITRITYTDTVVHWKWQKVIKETESEWSDKGDNSPKLML